MKSILVEINCRNCLYKTHKKSETLIMPDFEPQFRKELLEGSFFQKTCPNCGSVNSFLHPVLYADKQHRFVLLIKAKQEIVEKDASLFSSEPDCVKRYLSRSEDVAEKIRILEDGLDDRSIELLKQKLRLREKQKGQSVNDIIYQDATSDTIWFHVQRDACESDVIGVLKQSYERLCAQLPKQENRFVKVDAHWAKAYMQRMEEQRGVLGQADHEMKNEVNS